jgi:hypothetical protein
MSDFWANIHAACFSSEADVEFQLVEPLLAALGYSKTDIRPKLPVVFQEGRRGRKPEADFVVFYGPICDRNTSAIVIEAKAPDEKLESARAQAESYAFNVRAPFSLFTNGIELEIWQLQCAMDSTCVYKDLVANLESRRGDLESLIGKNSILKHLRSLQYKSILTATKDLGDYEIAEMVRTSGLSLYVGRNLTGENDQKVTSNLLLDQFKNGAVIVAASGLGKTMLCQHLHREAITARWQGQTGPISIEIALPDLAASGESLLAFAADRVSAHCPAVGDARFRDLLRNDGAILLCDGFDRIPEESRPRIEADLRNAIRDFPAIQIFVFTRKSSRPALYLPMLSIDELTVEQQSELQRAVLPELPYDVLWHLPRALRQRCGHPLLLTLILEHRRDKGKLPTDLPSLFTSWLIRTLSWHNQTPIARVACERALTVLACATTKSAISPKQAVQELRTNGFDDEIFNDLVRSDVLRIDGCSVELVHEALADFLRARDLAGEPEGGFSARVDSMPLQDGSLLPPLLMALLPSRERQQMLWRRLSQADFDTYVSAIRFQGDTSTQLAVVQGNTAVEAFLLDILNGCTAPIAKYFPRLRRALNESLSGQKLDELGIIGEISASGFVTYGFGRIADDGKRVRVASPSQLPISHGINLAPSVLRLDSGRLLGMQLIKRELLESARQRTLCGRLSWSRERIASRVHYMLHQGLLPIEATNIAWLRNTLGPHASAYVSITPFGRDYFSIQSVFDDIATLEDAGDTTIDFWWQRLGWSPSLQNSEDTISGLLAECYRRAQLIYAELVEESFAQIINHLGFYNCLPVRWTIDVHQGDHRRWANYNWMPVRTWNEADAEVRFPTEPRNLDLRDQFDKISAEFGRIGRSIKGTTISLSNGILPRFDGHSQFGVFDGETPAIRLSCEWIKRDLDDLFRDLPVSLLDV